MTKPTPFTARQTVHTMPAPCGYCWCPVGFIAPTGDYQCVSCSKRARIIDRDNGMCAGCDRSDIVNVGHLLSIEHGRKLGATDDELWADENLAAMCDGCEGGYRVSPLLLYRLLQVRLRASGRTR